MGVKKGVFKKDQVLLWRIRKAVKLIIWNDFELAFFTWFSVFMNIGVWIGSYSLAKTMGQMELITRYNVFLGIRRGIDLREKIDWLNYFDFTVISSGFLILNLFLVVMIFAQSFLSDVKKERNVNLLAGKLILFGNFIVQAMVTIFVGSLWIVNY